MSVLIGFLPWIFYWFLLGANEFETAAVGGLVLSIGWIVWSRASGKSFKLLDVGGLAFFAIMSILAAAVDDDWLTRWGYVLSDAALAAIVLASIAAGRPFTRQYAEEETPREVWDSPLFKQTTLVLSWMWFWVLALNILLAWLAIEFPDEEFWLGLAVPIGLVIIGLRVNHWYPDHASRRAQSAST